MTIVVAGCRHAPVREEGGRSSFTVVEPPPVLPVGASAETTEPTHHGQYRDAHLRNPVTLPVYPARALKARAGRATVGVHVTIDAGGRVADITTSMFVFSTPGPFATDFRDAVEAAVRQWKFDPARVEYLETRTENDFTYNRVTRTENVEAELDLAFTFTADGRVEQGSGDGK